MTRGEWWLLAHARGLHTFPLTAGMKTPTTGPWEKYKTERPSADQIRAWSGQGLNYGIICGTPNPENPDEQLAVIDVDKVDGWQSWLDDRGQEEPNTGWVTTTPRGGKHLPYWIPAEMAVSISKGCGPDGAWDIRGRGGYVVGPGCHTVDIGHPEKQVAGVYSVSGNDLIPGTAPDWLAAWFPIWAPAREGLGLDNEPPRHTTKSPSENTGNNQTWTIDGLENGREDYGTKTVWAVFRELIDRGGWTKETLAREMLEVAWTQYSAKATSRHPEGLEAEGRGKRMIMEKVQDCIRRNWDERAGEGGVPDPRKDEHPATEVSAPVPGLLRHYADIRYNLDQTWIFEDFLTPGALACLYGPPNSKKTFFALALSHAISTGSDFLGKRTKLGTVIYQVGEGRENFSRRIGAMKLSLDEHSPEPKLSIITETIDLSSDTYVQAMIDACHEAAEEHGEPVKLLVIDTLAQAMSGDENSTQDMNTLIRAAARIRDEISCAVLFIHHTGKDKERGARGSSALLGAVDTELRIDPGAKNKAGLDTSRVTSTKQRDGEKDLDLTFALQVVPLGVTAEGDTITSCVVIDTEQQHGAREQPLRPRARELQTVINNCCLQRPARPITLRPNDNAVDCRDHLPRHEVFEVWSKTIAEPQDLGNPKAEFRKALSELSGAKKVLGYEDKIGVLGEAFEASKYR